MGIRKNRLDWNHLGKVVITSTHNLCFGAKIRKKIGIPCMPQFCYIKMGVERSIHFMDMLFTELSVHGDILLFHVSIILVLTDV